jgi:hypothetical protein
MEKEGKVENIEKKQKKHLPYCKGMLPACLMPVVDSI